MPSFSSRFRAAIAASFVCAAVAYTAHALDPHRLVNQYRMRVWQARYGLPQNSGRAFLQDRLGFIWIGTEEGLARFDGMRFEVFDRRNTPQITTNFISSLVETPSGDLWIGT